MNKTKMIVRELLENDDELIDAYTEYLLNNHRGNELPMTLEEWSCGMGALEFGQAVLRGGIVSLDDSHLDDRVSYIDYDRFEYCTNEDFLRKALREVGNIAVFIEERKEESK